MLRGACARPSLRPATSAARRVPAQAVRMAHQAVRSISTAKQMRFSAARFRQAVQQTDALLSSRSAKMLNVSCVPVRSYAKDIEYPDWEQYEKFEKYEYRGEMHEEHQFWDPDSVVPEWDDNISTAELGYGLFCLAAAIFVLYLFANLSALYTPDPNMLESGLTPFGRHWVERGFAADTLPPIPEGRNEGLAAHNIYTIPNALDAIENKPGVKKYQN